jgi:hypothetical protein
MPDWKDIVRSRMAGLRLPGSVREDVIAEIAAHLQEVHDDATARGFSATAATELALQEVTDWRTLSIQITQAKHQEGLMNHRTKSFWLPALTTLLAASVTLMMCQFFGMQPRLVWVGNLGMTFYSPWLATLPIFGAVGAYLSRRAQGPPQTRLAAGLSPALVMLIVMGLLLPWGLAIDGLSFFRLVSFGLGLINWVAIPGIALLLGALPSLWCDAPAKA